LHNGNVGVIGDTLSAARARRQVDLEEVHAATGIRARYLRAIEEEDWEALPEDFYARSFIRKYAQFVGVDPEPLVEEFRRQTGASGRAGDAPTSPFAKTNSRKAEALRRRRARQGVYVWLGVGALAVAVVVAIVLISSGGGEENGSSGSQDAGGNGNAKGTKGANAGKGKSGSKGKGGNAGANGKGATAGTSTAVALAIEPTAEVWACVLDAEGKPLVNGQTLAAGEAVGPFHARSYTAAFGNGSVTVKVDGKHVATPDTPSPMGFTVNGKGKLRELPEGERPSCE
jgi:cytoskeleton protein RodZ